MDQKLLSLLVAAAQDMQIQQLCSCMQCIVRRTAFTAAAVAVRLARQVAPCIQQVTGLPCDSPFCCHLPNHGLPGLPLTAPRRRSHATWTC